MFISSPTRNALLATLAREHVARLTEGEDIRAIIDEGCAGDIGASLPYLNALRELDTPESQSLLADWLPVAVELAYEDFARLRELQGAAEA